MLHPITPILLLLLAMNLLHGASAPLTPIRSQADQSTDSSHLISTPATPALPSSLQVTYDLSQFRFPQTALAQLHIAGSNSAPQDGLAPSLSVRYDGNIVASTTFRADVERAQAALIVTEAVNNALAAGKQEITFTISQRGTPGTQRSFLADKNPRLVLQQEQAAPYDIAVYLRPIWKSGTLTNESIFFLAPEDKGPAQGELLFTPNKILSAHSGDLRTEYHEGTDFKVEGNTVTLLPGSRISSFTYDEFYPKSQSGQKIRTFSFPGLNRFALSPEGAWFQQHQIFFTYEHDGAGWLAPRFGQDFDPTHLPATTALLNSDEPLKIILFGDSISAGANASASAAARPYMPSFGNLLTSALRGHYDKNNITFINPSLGGMNSQWALRHVESLVASEHPDLVVIAFGMNDRLSPQEYARHVEAMMRIIRSHNPQTEFILVAPMQANSLWRDLAPHSGYVAELKKLQAPGVFVADVWSAHAELLKAKKYSDMTGNNVNHPNDFLIRVYAQIIAEPLMPL